MLHLRNTRLHAACAHISDDQGATAAEYALLLSFIAAIIVASVTLLGGTLSTIFANFAAELL